MAPRRQTEFGDFLDDVLRKRGWSLRDFARKTGVPAGSVSAAKRFTLNPRRFAPWADALELTGTDRERFVRLAWLAHAPVAVQTMVATLEHRIKALEADQKPKKRRR